MVKCDMSLRMLILILGVWFLAFSLNGNAKNIANYGIEERDWVGVSVGRGESAQKAVSDAIAQLSPILASWWVASYDRQYMAFGSEIEDKFIGKIDKDEISHYAYESLGFIQKSIDKAEQYKGKSKLSSSTGIVYNEMAIEKIGSEFYADLSVAVSWNGIKTLFYNDIVKDPNLYKYLQASPSFLALEAEVLQRREAALQKMESEMPVDKTMESLFNEDEADYRYYGLAQYEQGSKMPDTTKQVEDLSMKKFKAGIENKLSTKTKLFAKEAKLPSSQKLDEIAKTVAHSLDAGKLRSVIKQYTAENKDAPVEIVVAYLYPKALVWTMLEDRILQDKDLAKQLKASAAFIDFQKDSAALKKTAAASDADENTISDQKLEEMRKTFEKGLR